MTANSETEYSVPTVDMMPRIEIACAPPMDAIANAIYNATGARMNKPPPMSENFLSGRGDS